MTTIRRICTNYLLLLIWTLLLLSACSESDIEEANEILSEHLASQFGELQKLLDHSIAQSSTPGAVMLIQTPSTVWIGASGLANVETQTPMKATDLLRIGSMTKTFVAALMLKLSEEGKLNLDDRIADYLPGPTVQGIQNGSEVTIRQLLNMTSGIFSYTDSDEFNDAVEAQPGRAQWRPEEVLEFVYDADGDFFPGTGWTYSNTNYVLLELIVQQATGTTLAAEMRRTIHTPLGLTHTYMELHEPRPGGFGGLMVRGYDDGEDITEINDGLGLADGGVISDAPGVAKFLNALFREKTLLSQRSLDQMRDFHPTEDYGLGLERRQTPFGEAWGHSGSTAGFQSDMVYLPEKQITFVILTNDFNTDILEPVFESSMKIVFE
jgi:D-alanyl-D-alanine carboxypeptidase